MTNRYLPLCFAFLLLPHLHANAQECGKSILVGNNTKIEIDAKGAVFRKLTPQFFGFNLELLEFQDSLWNKQSNRVENEVIALLSRFPGAVYRYPGGTIANHFDWHSAVGPMAQRTPQKTVDYQDAKTIAFGPIEYLNFVKQVKGSAWYVLNMHGTVRAADTPKNLAVSAADLLRFLGRDENKGLPKVFKWELGNELDRGRYRWAPDAYANVAKEIGSAVRAQRSDAELVVMGQDWEHTGARLAGADYNRYTAGALASISNEYSFHLYYDGPPWGPPLPRVIKQLCKNISSTQLPASGATTWVTEYGKTPAGTPADSYWKGNWTQTGSLSAAVSAADLLITLAPLGGVNGAFVHSLHGTAGPWPMFHKRHDGVIYPSAVYWALIMLQESMQEDVLNTKIASLNNSGNGVGYDTNSLVMANPERSVFSIWTAQRGNASANIATVIPQLAGKKVLIKTTTLSGADLSDSNYTEQYKVFPKRSETTIQVGPTGEFSYSVPAYSVTSLMLSIASDK